MFIPFKELILFPSLLGLCTVLNFIEYCFYFLVFYTHVQLYILFYKQKDMYIHLFTNIFIQVFTLTIVHNTKVLLDLKT